MPVPTPSPSLGTRAAPVAPLQPRAQAPSETALRAALDDDSAWAQLIADPLTRSQTENWLKATSQSIDAQLIIRRDEFDAWAAADLGSDFHESETQYRAWRKKAISMKTLCQKRLAQLKLRWVEANKRIDGCTQIIAELGKAIADHQLNYAATEHTSSVAEDRLWAHLDKLTLPGDDQFTVRDLVNLRS